MGVPVVRPSNTPERIFTASRFAALTHELRSAGTASVDVALQVVLAQFKSGRAAVDDASQRGSVTLAEGRHREQFADRVT